MFRNGVRAGGFNMVKCGPDQEVGIRVAVDKSKIKPPCVYRRGRPGNPYTGEGSER